MSPTWQEVVLAGLNVIQTVFLAFLAADSRHLRQQLRNLDRRRAPTKLLEQDPEE